MKKITSILLALMLVFSLCSVFAFAKGSVNLAQGEGVTLEGAPKYDDGTSNYSGDLLDNQVGTDKYDSLWAGFYNNKTSVNNNYDGKNGIIVMDLGKVYANIDSIEAHIWDHKGVSGVASPAHIYISASVDGETYTDLGELTFGAEAIDWATLTLSSPVNARYIKYNFDKGSNGGVFMFVSELAVWGDGTEAKEVVEDKVINLLTEAGELIITSDGYEDCPNDKTDIVASVENGVFTAQNKCGYWPNAEYRFTTPITVDVANTYLEIEATFVNGNGGSIRLLGPVNDPAAVETDDIYLQQFDPDVTLDGSGDAPAGSTVSYKLPISELAYCIYDEASDYAGKKPITESEIVFTGVQVFSSGKDNVVTITKLNLVVPGSGAEVVMEEITVDGDVTDTGWAKKGWIKVSGDNGSWQYPTHKEVAEGTPIPTFTYTHQLRADETKLYGAVVLNGVHEVVDGEAKNIKVRIWFRDNDEATVYSSFYDFVLAPDGTLTTAAKYNQSTTANSGALIENTTLEAVAKVVNGKTVYEFSIALDEVTKDGNFDYFISLERKQNVNTGTLYYPFIPELAETSPHGNYPWMLWYTANDATVAVEDILLGEVPAEDENEDEADTSMMGDAPAAPKFSATLNGPEAWVAGEKVKIDVVIEVLEDELALNQILFNLFFDAADVEITLPDDDFSALVTAAPADSWKSENAMFALSTVDGYGLISGGVGSENEADSLKKGDKVVVSFEFTAKADAEGLINFQLSNDELAGYTYADPATAIAGAGSNLAIAEKTDDLGDAGIYAIAALAIVALIGTAVVIKKRA